MKTRIARSLSKKLTRVRLAIAVGLFVGGAGSVSAAGILTPSNSADTPLNLVDHHVEVTVNNGFARTTVEQVFFNPNTRPVEAIYSAPVPEKAALSELMIWSGEHVLRGEVVKSEEADRIYQEEKDSGNDVAKASQDSYLNYEFAVAAVPAQGKARMRYAYYEPLEIDTGVGRYVYRVEEGGTDEEASRFWSGSDAVSGNLTIDVTIHSAWPVDMVRAPGFSGTSETGEDGAIRYSYASSGGALNQDFVLYYKLADDLPGRLETIVYREKGDKPGTFMMVLTPGVDLQPLSEGSDYVFILDVSGSMSGKLRTLVSGVKRSLGVMNPEDRFRIVAFNDSAWSISGEWRNASQSNVERALQQINGLQSSGGTNLYAGVGLGLKSLDSDRVSSIVLVTDGVTNQGIVDPKAFHSLLQGKDVRLFGFLLGNSANWPLMRLMCEASGGYYKSVSNADDIVGEIMLAKNKIVYDSLRDARVSIDGVDAFDVSDFRIGKIHYGEQLVLFGRYGKPGSGKVSLQARIGGEDKRYETTVAFPEFNTDYPEIERLWAMDQVRKISLAKMSGMLDASEANDAIADLGVAYQIVTDETSMLALDDAGFDRHGIDRRNLERMAVENEAAVRRVSQVGATQAKGQAPMFNRNAPSIGGGGGGALEPWFALILVMGGGAWAVWGKRKGALLSVLALGLILLANPSSGYAKDRSGYGVDWRERAMSVDARSSYGSIDQSIENFWEISEAQAREPAPVSRSEPSPERAIRSDRAGGSPIPQPAKVREVKQTRDSNQSKGHFGINLFNAIPLFDFVWGDSRESRSDRFEGRTSK